MCLCQRCAAFDESTQDVAVTLSGIEGKVSSLTPMTILVQESLVRVKNRIRDQCGVVRERLISVYCWGCR